MSVGRKIIQDSRRGGLLLIFLSSHIPTPYMHTKSLIVLCWQYLTEMLKNLKNISCTKLYTGIDCELQWTDWLLRQIRGKIELSYLELIVMNCPQDVRDTVCKERETDGDYCGCENVLIAIGRTLVDCKGNRVLAISVLRWRRCSRGMQSSFVDSFHFLQKN